MDRREIHHLLARLHPADRVRYLEKCCANAVLNGSQIRPKLSRKTYEWAEAAVRGDSGADDRLTLDCYVMLWELARHYNFCLSGAVLELERWGKRSKR